MARQSRLSSGFTDDIDEEDEEAKVDYMVIPPDGGWGWFVVFAAFLINFVVDGTMYTFGIFMKELVDDFEVPESQVSIANSLTAAFYFLLGPVACAVTNRMGFRFTVVLGGAIASVSLLAASFMTEIIYFIIIYGFGLGIGFGLMYIATILVVGFYFDRWRAVATAISVVGSAVGCICIPPIMNIALVMYDWRMKYRFLVGALIFASLMGLSYKPIPPMRIVPADKQKYQEEKQSMMSISMTEENPKSIFYKMHNQEFPTNAELAQKASYTLEEADEPTTGQGQSVTTFKSAKSFRQFKARQSAAGADESFQSDRMTVPELGRRRRPCVCCKCCECCMWYCYCCICAPKHVQRPMYKDDIFYTGSIAAVGMAKGGTQADVRTDKVGYHMSVSRVATPRDIKETRKCCVCCPEAVVRTLATMLDFSLMKNASFNFLLMSGFFSYVGIYVPYMFIVNSSEDCDMNKDLTTYLIPVIGITNACGRFACGATSFIPKLSPLVVSYMTIMIGGAAMIALTVPNTISIYVCVGVFGFCIASIAALRPVVAVNMVGLGKLTNAFGLIVMFQGFPCLFGVPLASTLHSLTGTYDTAYYFAGFFMILSGVVLIPIPCLLRREAKRQEQQEEEKQRKAEEKRQKLEKINAPAAARRR